MGRITFSCIAFVVGLLFLGAVCAVTVGGCSSFGRFIGGIGTSPDRNVSDPGTSTGRMWETIKRAKGNLFTSWAIPIIAIGAVIVFNGMAKIGFSVIIFGSINLFVSLATAKFALPMAIFGFVGTVLAVLASILFKNKALKDIICNVQNIKQNVVDDPSLQQLSFQEMVSKTLDKQLKSTKKIVKKVKSKMKLKGRMVSVRKVK